MILTLHLDYTAMSIEIDWDNEEKTIVRYTFYPGWTVADFHAAYAKVGEFIKEAKNRVIGVIVDDSQDSLPPANALNAFKRTVREGKLPIVLVGVNLSARMMVDVAQQVFKPNRPLFYADTLEEAREILQQLANQEVSDSSSETPK